MALRDLFARKPKRVIGIGSHLENAPPVVRFAAATYAGPDKSHNDDCFSAMQLPGGRGALYAVADGVGARKYSYLVSALAVQQVLRGCVGVPLRELIKAVSADLHAYNNGNKDLSYQQNLGEEPDSTRGDSATTLVVARVTDKAVEVAWVGDSRAYFWSPKDGLRQITEDQHDDRGTCALGIHDEVMPEPLLALLPALRKDERILLCSDGAFLNPDDLSAILCATTGAPQDAVNAILSMKVSEYLFDDATVLVAERPLPGTFNSEEKSLHDGMFSGDGRILLNT